MGEDRLLKLVRSRHKVGCKLIPETTFKRGYNE